MINNFIQAIKFLYKKFYKKGSYLYYEKDPSNMFYIVLQGTVGLKERKYSDENYSMVVDFRNELEYVEITNKTAIAGEIFGENEIIYNVNREFNAKAEEDTWVCCFNKICFENSFMVLSL